MDSPNSAPASAPTSGPSGSPGGSPSPAPTGPGQSSGGPGIAPPGSSQTAPQGSPPPTTEKVAPKRDPWLRKVRIGEGETAAEHELDLSPHLAEYRHRLKVMGKDEEASIEQLAEAYPLAVGARQKFTEATKLRQEAAAERQTFEQQRAQVREALSDPKSAFLILSKSMGSEANVVAWMEGILDQRYAYEKATPEQRRAMDAERQKEDGLSARERTIREGEAREKTRRAEEHKRTTAANLEQLKKTVPAALEAAGVPSTPGTMSQFVAVKLAAKEAGVPMTDAQAAAAVKREVDALMGGLKRDPKSLRAALGEDGAEMLRASEVERLNEPGRRAQRVEAAPQAPRQQAPQRKETLEQLRERRREENEAAEQRRLSR